MTGEAVAYLPTHIPENPFWGCPGWLYPVLGLAGRAFALGLAEKMMRRIGAATVVTLAFNLGVPAPLALDAWYWRQGNDSQNSRVARAALFGAVLLAVSLPTTLTMIHLVHLYSAEIAVTAICTDTLWVAGCGISPPASQRVMGGGPVPSP